jgi:hypothetical protein
VEDDAGKDFVLCVDDHSVGCCLSKVNKLTIVVISAHARFISAMPILLLGCVFTCYGPSAFCLAVVEQNTLMSVTSYQFNHIGIQLYT